MNNTDMRIVQQKLEGLVGKRLTGLHRACEMLCLRFQAPQDPLDRLLRGEAGEMGLHLQCYYRLVKDEQLLLASNDYFQPSDAMWDKWHGEGYEEDYIPEDFRCDELGANRLDDRMQELLMLLPQENFTVKTVLVDSLGDLTLCFHNGAVLTVLLDTTGGEECWRLLPENEEDAHTVMYADGVEYE